MPHARRPGFHGGKHLALAAGVLVLATGCHDKRHPSPGSARSSPGAITAQDLKLDLARAPNPAQDAPPEAARLGMTLESFQKRWNAEAPKHKTARVTGWKRQDIVAFQAWRASYGLGPGVRLEVIGIGKDTVQTAQVSAAPMGPDKLERLFNGWETLRATVTPGISRDQLYKGLGLLSKPSARTRYMAEAGYVWRIASAPLRPPPDARLSLAVHRAEPKPAADKPFSMLVKLGSAGDSGNMGAFGLEYDPSSRGKTFEEAATLCKKQGLSLCTGVQWQRACSQLAPLSTLSTWTGSFNKDLTRLQARGGGKSCDSGGPVQPGDTDPKRGALCCTRNIAMTGSGSSAMKGLFTIPILELEQAINRKDWTQLAEALTPKLERFESLENTTRAGAVKLAMENAAKHPHRWSEHESCDLTTGNRQMHFLLKCKRNIFDKDQGMVTLVQYGVSESRIEFMRRVKVLRKMGPIEATKHRAR